MAKFELNDKQAAALGKFLGRASLQGLEVGEFNDLLKALNNPVLEKPVTPPAEVKE